MSFCANCGKRLADNAKCCIHCGSPTTDAQNCGQDKYRQEYIGKVKKCPACSEDIPALTAICPVCGHEFNSAKVSDILQEFIDKINECDQKIAYSPNPPKTGWTSWSKTKRIWWVVLNIFTSCIPLVIYLVLPLLRYSGTPKLTAAEKQKASLIENFSFPNDRESILEALLFAKSKVAFLASEKVDSKTAYWTRIWSTKAEQLYQKAEIMFKGDSVASDAIKEITSQKDRVIKTVRFKAIAGIVILVVAFAFAGIKNGSIDTTDYSTTFEWQTNDLFSYLPDPEIKYGQITQESEKQIQIELYKVSPEQFNTYVKACREKGFTTNIDKTNSVFYADNANGLNLSISYYASNDVMKISLDSYSVEVEAASSENIFKPSTVVPEPTIGFDNGTYQNIIIENFTFSIPNYWEEEGSKEEYAQYYAETGGKVAILAIAYPIDDVDDVTLDLLIEDNDNMIKSIESMCSDCEVTGHESFVSDYGVEGIVYDFSFTFREFLVKYNMNGKLFCFPSTEDNRWFYVIIGASDNTETDFDEYIKDYTAILASIRES